MVYLVKNQFKFSTLESAVNYCSFLGIDPRKNIKLVD